MRPHFALRKTSYRIVQKTFTRRRMLVPLCLALTFSFPAVAKAQQDQPSPGHRIQRSPPPPGVRTHTVVPGQRFAAGSFKSWFYGSDYRALWTTPIEVAVLDLDGVGGGLTPLRTGGFGQSISLHFSGEDGRRYTVRSLDKDPTKRIWDELKNTVVDDVLQDQISALLPTGALVVDALMEATGILHSKHTLVVIPDDPRLQEYREDFAGLVGTLQEHPSEGLGDTPGFAGSRKISGTEKLWQHLEKTPCNRVDSRAFLKARLLDFLINDKDRHSGQWRWARFPAGACHSWIPIPEDRDQAFIDYDGFAMALARRVAPKQIEFADSYPNLAGLSMNGWDLDRQFLVELDKSAWDSMVKAFVGDLPDAVIEAAVRRLPPPYYEIVGPALAGALKSRRDKLAEFVDSYYALIMRQAEIKATDRDEYLECEHLPNGDLMVRIGLLQDPGGARNPPYFQRLFRPGETREVRIYLHGGSDLVELSGAQARIVLRIDGGGGDDTFSNSSQASASKIFFYDFRGKNQVPKGGGVRLDERPYKRPAGKIVNARYALDWGMQAISLPLLTTSPDLGVFAGFLSSRHYFGYRKAPFSSRHTYNLGVASNGFKPFVSYKGLLNQALFDLDATLRLKYSGIQVIRFNGMGNETKIPEPPSFYKVEQEYFIFAPGFEFRTGESNGGKQEGGEEARGSVFTIGLEAIAEYSNTSPSANSKRFIGTPDSLFYGTGSFGQLGVRAQIAYDTRDNPGYATSGFLARASAALYPGIWDVASAFGSIQGEALTFMTAPIPTNPTLALRAGGKKVWGTFPFHEAAYLGGPGFAGSGISDGNLRGYAENRFGGDSSLYGNAELRLVLARIKLLVPGEFGLFGAADSGRVFFAQDPEEADNWHTGLGGGIWLSFLQRLQTLSVALVKGDELRGLYLRAGFMF